MKAQGVEIDPKKIQKAIARGVSAYQSDIEAGLADYPDRTFDFVILSQTLQEMRYPLRVLREMLRVGRRRDCGVPEFRSLEHSFLPLIQRAGAPDETLSLRLVRIAQPSLPDRQGLYPPLPGAEVAHRTSDLCQRASTGEIRS